nr:hypothetical protein [Tanacetum cinerariifolium]
MMDYALWEVIENGATLPKTHVMEGVTKEMPITTAKEKAQRRLEVKERNSLMMGIPNEHQLKFNFIKDAKQLLKAIEKILKLVSQLELLGEKLSQEHVNQKLLRSLSPEWNTHVVMWRNKAELDTMSMDDLYNNLKVTNGAINNANGVSTASTQVNAAFSTNIDNLSDSSTTATRGDTLLESAELQGIKTTIIRKAHEGAEKGPNYARMAYTSSSYDSKGNPQIDLQDQGVIDSGCLRHMTGNMYYPTDYEEIDGGYVAFGGNPKGGKITGKEVVNTACYVKNRVLVVKPHNKTPYELFHGKFDGKADEGFFVGYSLNSKAFRVFNNRTRIVEENLHIRFSESTPNVVGSGQDWLFDIDALTRTMNYEPIVAGTQSNDFAGTKASNNAGQARKEREPVKDYILLTLWTADLPFSQDPKSSQDDGFKPLSEDGKKVDEDPSKGNECYD